MKFIVRFLTFVCSAGLAFAQFPPNCQVVPAIPGPQNLFCPIPGNPSAPLLVYAHGYVNPGPVVGLPLDQLVIDNNGTPLPLSVLVNSLGYAFAASSYTENGLAIKQGVNDTLALIAAYKGAGFTPSKVYVAGVSEGGLVAAKIVEEHSQAVDGGMALCGPIGDFRRQVDHFGDYRAVFDYFFPGLMPGNAVFIPNPAPKTWADYVADIQAAAAAKPGAFSQTYKVEDIPVDPSDFSKSAVDVLRYSFFATNDANAKLGGNPFDNRFRWYFGSTNDFLMNWKIKRYRADSAALNEIAANYQTSGMLPKTLVTMHTTGDPVVPYWHMNQYGLKVLLKGSLGNYAHIPVFRYGHCAFEPAEIVFGFAVMVAKSGGTLTLTSEALPDEQQRLRFRQLERQQSGVLQ